jgi:hypothetical protein
MGISTLLRWIANTVAVVTTWAYGHDQSNIAPSFFASEFTM